MRLFIDECLSPELANRLNGSGAHEAVHPRDYGRLGEPDHAVLRRCLDEDRTIVTQNARDFRKLVGREEVHPGLIILPAVGRERSWTLLQAALQTIAAKGDPGEVMINRVAEVDETGVVQLFDLPPSS